VVSRARSEREVQRHTQPACVGWLDRDLPGWSRKDLDASLKLVRELMAPDWDFHPEMITHTWVIDTKTGALTQNGARGSWRTGAGQTANRRTGWPST